VIEIIVKFVTSYNDVIIAVLGSLVLILAGLAIYYTYFVNSSPEAKAEKDLSQIEESLKKLILEIHKKGGVSVSAGASVAGDISDDEGAGASDAAGSASVERKKSKSGSRKEGPLQGASASGSGQQDAAGESFANSEALSALKDELENKKLEIEALKGRVQGTNLDNTAELLAKIKILEQRLAEYAIIEDDIADLSIFKEENIRLKKELEGMKEGKAPEAPAAEAAPAPAPEPVPEPAPEVAAAPAEEPKPAAAPEPSNDELMAEFDAAADKLEPDTSPKESSGEATSDVFSEFSNEGASEDPLGDFDPDKMLKELHGIDSSGGSADVVHEKSDMNKMADEAKKL
jgi:hypothetical protein